jgi:hypothetical protein
VAKRRKDIPASVRLSLLMEAGYKCGNPACRNVITLEHHHIEYVSEGGGDEPSNLLTLCPYCHSMHHAGQIPLEAVRHWKGLLVALNQAFDRRGMDLLLFLHRTVKSPIMYSGDGVLTFAGLIGAGLVGLTTSQVSIAPGWVSSGTGFEGTGVFGQTSHHVGLTPKGRLLVEARLKGDEKMFVDLISLPRQPVEHSRMERSNS